MEGVNKLFQTLLCVELHMIIGVALQDVIGSQLSMVDQM